MVGFIVLGLLSTFSEEFFSETTVPISVKFHMQPPGKVGKKVYLFGPGHRTKLATMPIYGTYLKNSSLESLGT